MLAGQSERVDFLRARIASLEAVGAFARGQISRGERWQKHVGEERGEQVRVALGEASRLCSLDLALQGGLPLGALHELVAARPGDQAAASGFAAALGARFAHHKRISSAKVIWIVETKAVRETGMPYAPGLSLCGFDPAQFVLVETGDARESLWAMEEALKCSAPAVVIAEIWGLAKIYDLAASRRLVLAARKSGTPGLLVAAGFAGAADRVSSGAATRFAIAPSTSVRLPSAGGRLPLPGSTAWAVRLIKARAGPKGFGFDRNKVHRLIWDPEKVCFRDALSLGLSPLFGNRPSRPAWSFSQPHTSADATPKAACDVYEDQVSVTARGTRSPRVGARA
jgi:protein ImuA